MAPRSRFGSAPRAVLSLLALGVAGCADTVGSGPPLAQLALQPTLPGAVAPGVFDLDVDRARIRLTRPPVEPVLDTLVFFPANAPTLSVRLRVPLLARRENLNVSVELSSNRQLLFAGTRLVEVSDQLSTATVPLQYVGPGAGLTALRIEPRDSVLKLGDRFTFRVFGFVNLTPIEEFYVGWSTSDGQLAPIDAEGTITAPVGRGSVMVRVVSPTGVRDSTRIWFSPPPASMALAGGDQQIGQVGTTLGALLGVRLVAPDGLGVPGVSVRFVALSGGSVRDTIAVSDELGVARTVATLGPFAGNQQFEAIVEPLPPVFFNAVAVAGPPARMLPLSGGGQSAPAGETLAQPFVASVTDAVGNPVGGVAVVWSVVEGGGALTEISAATDPSGLASARLRLGPAPGVNLVRVSIPGTGLALDFTATATAP